MKTRRIHLVSRPNGAASVGNFELVESEVPLLKAGQVLVENTWMSVDPYMRRSMDADATDLEPWPLFAPLSGPSVGRVIETRNAAFQTGDLIESMSGWQEHFVSDGDALVPYLSPDTAIVRRQLMPGGAERDFVGLLGVASQTGYFGMTKAVNMIPGQTVVVSSAAGTVGSVACQIAKLYEMHVVASAGSEKKVRWLKDKAKVDFAFNYKATAFADAFREGCPDGIDLVLENASPAHFSACLPFMNDDGTILIAGFVGIYETGGKVPNINNFEYVLDRFLTIKSYPFMRYIDAYDDFARDMVSWRNSGQLIFEEAHYRGIADAPLALLDLLAGRNIGKPLIELRGE